MDIEINEVQEIIKSLEIGGELSIKEEKYLKVAKLCGKLVAERDAATLEYDYLNDQIEYWKNKSINITEQRNELDADLPPLEHENVHYADAAEMEIAALRQRIAKLESRTVTFKLPSTLEPSPFAPWIAKAFYQFHKDTVNSCVTAFSDACAEAGIKLKVE